MRLLECVLVFVTHVEEGGHVNLLERRQHRSRVLALLQTLRNALAHATHRNTCL